MFATKHMRRVAVIVGAIAVASLMIWGGPLAIIPVGCLLLVGVVELYRNFVGPWVDAGDEDDYIGW